MNITGILGFLLLLLSLTAFGSDSVYEINQLIKKGKKEEALAQIDAYLSSQPKDVWGRNITQMRFTKGTLLADLHRNDEAIRVFGKLIQDYPELPEPYNNLAALYSLQGRHEEARDLLERSLRTDPAYATAYRNLNEVYARLATNAYEQTSRASKGAQPATALVKELCDNYGRIANQSVGRKHVGGEMALVREIPKNRSVAAAPPSKVDIDEMAVETPATGQSALPPAFINPAVNPAPALPSVVVSAKKESSPVRSSETSVGVVAKPAEAKKEESRAEKSATPERAAPDAEKAVIAAVRGWAGAWSRKNAGAYLGYYAGNFQPPNGQTRAEWSKLRKERIAKPKRIQVSVEGPKVTLVDAMHATVSFRQSYRSDDLQTSTRKLLLMVKKGDKWLIQEERVGG